MVCSCRDSRVRRLCCLCLAVLIFFSGLTPAYATSGTATTSSQIGTSMYDVSTALTAFANYALGPNSNDKHGDIVALGGGVDSDRSHKLWELNQSGITVGDSGCYIGYGDASKGFKGYIMNNAVNSVTTSSYSTYIKSGDGGRSYAYVRYGRLLTDLGIDETGNPAKTGWDRATGGLLLQGVYLISSFIPKLFEIAFEIMNALNPFRFLIGSEEMHGQTQTGGNVATGTNVEAGSDGLVITNPWDETETGIGTVDTGDVELQNIDGLDRTDIPGYATALKPLFDYVTNIYMMLRSIGLWIIMPLMTALLLCTLFMFKQSNKWPAVQKYLVRFVFIVVGIPFLGIMYTAVLDAFADMSANQNRPSTRIIASSLVDFENWCKTWRLEPPAGNMVSGGSSVTLESEGGESEAEAQGKASTDSWRTVRETIYQVNRATGLYLLKADSGLGLSASGDFEDYDAYAGMVDVNREDHQLWVSGVVDGTGVEQDHFNRMSKLIANYMSGDFYTASAWESDVNSIMVLKYQDAIGTSVATAASTAIEETIYQMYSDGDEANDWFNRQQEENAQIFSGASLSGGSGGVTLKWVDKEWNIFANGGDMGVSGTKLDELVYNDPPTNTPFKTDIKYTHSSGISGTPNGIDPSVGSGGSDMGLSSITMYNYLCTAFNASGISTYSSQNTTSEYTRLQHYAVNMAGTGITRVAFLLNCVVVLGIYVILGAYYALGMVIDVLKHGFSMIMSIPAAMFGVMKSIVQVCAYVLQMVAEIMSSVWLYEIVMELVLVFATIVETPIMKALNNLNASAVVGGILADSGMLSLTYAIANCRPLFAVSLFFVILGCCGLCFGAIVAGRALMSAFTYVHYRIAYWLTLDEFRPWFADQLRNRGSLDIWDTLRTDAADAAGTAGRAFRRVPGISAGKGGVSV